MDVDEEIIVSRKCYKLEQPIYDNLTIFYNSSNSVLILWNKYQIFIYQDWQLVSAKRIVPEFQIQRLIASNNYLVCLDNQNRLYTATLKFKSSHKTLQIPFQIREGDIKVCTCYKQDYVLSLKNEADTYCLFLHRINSKFDLIKIVILLSQDDLQIGQNSKEKYVLLYHTVAEDKIEYYKTLLKLESSNNITYELVILSFDNFTVYGCLFSPEMDVDEVSLVKLYSCPAEICNLEIIESGELHLNILLKMGTLIQINLNDTSKSANIVHFNTYLHKTLSLNDCIIYTDGEMTWKAENVYDDIRFTQFFVKDVYDFVKCGDTIICTTFTKHLYTFSMEDENALIRPEVEEYCPAAKLLDSFEYGTKIFEEFDKNCQIVEKLTSEQDYISALALANKQNVVHKAIESKVLVYENYEDVNKTELTLTEELKEYFTEPWLILITITYTCLFDVLKKILTNLSENIRIYITFSTNNTILKTTTVKLKEALKKINILIPLQINVYKVKVDIKIVVKIPGALDKKPIWTDLYKHNVILNCEHFIKMGTKSSIYLKNEDSVEELIHKNNLNNHDFEFNLKKENHTNWSFYVKLPQNYEYLFKNGSFFAQHFNPIRATFLLEKLNAKEFLNAKSCIMLMIGDEKLGVKIQNDGFSNPLLIVTSLNINMAYGLRNFLAKMLYNDYKNQEGKDFINNNFYTATENLQKAVKDCITKNTSFEEFLPLMDRVEKHVIGHLPL